MRPVGSSGPPPSTMLSVTNRFLRHRAVDLEPRNGRDPTWAAGGTPYRGRVKGLGRGGEADATPKRPWCGVREAASGVGVAAGTIEELAGDVRCQGTERPWRCAG